MDVVKTSLDHPTAETVYGRAKQVMKNLSLGTVYRNLALLTELGEIRRLASPDGPDHFDFNLSCHHHFFCKSCKEMTDIPNEYAPKQQTLLPTQKNGFDVEGLNLCYIGTCPNCKTDGGN